MCRKSHEKHESVYMELEVLLLYFSSSLLPPFPHSSDALSPSLSPLSPAASFQAVLCRQYILCQASRLMPARHSYNLFSLELALNRTWSPCCMASSSLGLENRSPFSQKSCLTTRMSGRRILAHSTATSSSKRAHCPVNLTRDHSSRLLMKISHYLSTYAGRSGRHTNLPK